jgi:hypothetical protein
VVFELAKIRVGYSFSRYQLQEKLRSQKILGAFDEIVDKELNALGVQVLKDLTVLTEAAFKSTVPIASEYKKGISQKLLKRISNEDKKGLYDKGVPSQQIVKILQSEAQARGGTLRSSIRTNLDQIGRYTGKAIKGEQRPRTLEGRVWIPEGFHKTPYDPDSTNTLIGVAEQLDTGKYKSKKSNKSAQYLRSRPSLAEPGFHSEAGFTTGWIKAAEQQLQPLISTYMNSPKVLYEFSSINSSLGNQGLSPQALSLKDFVTNQEAAFISRQSEIKSSVKAGIEYSLKQLSSKKSEQETQSAIETGKGFNTRLDSTIDHTTGYFDISQSYLDNVYNSATFTVRERGKKIKNNLTTLADLLEEPQASKFKARLFVTGKTSVGSLRDLYDV